MYWKMKDQENEKLNFQFLANRIEKGKVNSVPLTDQSEMYKHDR